MSSDKSYYIGFFKDGEYDAEGYFVNSEGNIFLGNFWKGCKHGFFIEII